MLNRVMKQLHDSAVNPRLELVGVAMTMYDSRTNFLSRSWERCVSILARRCLKQ